jgi:HTH-type transcriptional regulator/antitoxin HigA
MEMNAQFAIAPIVDAWENFHATSGIGHIADERDYEASTRLADELLDEGAMEEGHPRHSLFMMLSDLIYAFDQRHYPIPNVQGVQVLRFLMKQHDLKQTQIPEIGSQSVVSEILAGKRSLTVDHIRNLSERFGISPNSFF